MKIKEKLDTIRKILKIKRDLAPSMKTIRYWVKEFQRDHTSIADEDDLDLPVEVITAEIIESVHGIIFSDRRIEVLKHSSLSTRLGSQLYFGDKAIV